MLVASLFEGGTLLVAVGLQAREAHRRFGPAVDAGGNGTAPRPCLSSGGHARRARPSVDPRPRVHRPGSNGPRRLRREREGRPARGRAGISARLVRRAPQHGDHRVVGDERPHRAHRLEDAHDPGRRRGHHASQSCAARDRGAVRHARGPASRPHRPRSGAGSGDGSRPRRGRCAEASRRPIRSPKTSSSSRPTSRGRRASPA